MTENKNLIQEIETLRGKLILTGMSKGLTAPETVQISQQLDELLYIQQKKPVSLRMTDPIEVTFYI